MFMVYWVESRDKMKIPHCKEFDAADMTAALLFMESLRTVQREGGDIGHVTMSSENPNSVGHRGVDVTGPDYSWKKRRK